MKQIDSKLGKYFRDQRLKAGLSQRALSELLGYNSAQMISAWETQLCVVPLEAISKMIGIFDIVSAAVVDIIIEENRRYLTAKIATAGTHSLPAQFSAASEGVEASLAG